MLGSAAIVAAWQQAFLQHGVMAGQILVTHHEIDDKSEGGRLRSVIDSAMDNGIIPIINENDVLSDAELAKLCYGGDNDGLAAKIAEKIAADGLLLLTNVDGVLDQGNKVVREVLLDDCEHVMRLANGKSECGRGGMESKIKAAAYAGRIGVRVCIGNSQSEYDQLLDGRTGTHFHAS